MRTLFFLSLACITAVAACSSTAADPITPPDAGSPTDAGPADALVDAPASPLVDAAPPAPTIGLADAADALGAAQCAFAARCFPDYLAAFAGSLATCEAGLSVEAGAAYAPDAMFDEAAIAATTSCFANLSCDTLYGEWKLTSCLPPAPVNAKPVGAECNKPNDCASTVCTGGSTAACGQCTASTVVGIGQACGGAGKICSPGLLCSGTCYRPLALGDSCTGEGSTTPTSCGNALKCVAGKCAKPNAAGGPCKNQSDCDVYLLQTCDATAGVCKPLDLAGLDAACDPHADIPPCGDGLRCITAPASGLATCRPPIASGGACVSSDSCALGYHCHGGVCTKQGAERPVCK